MRFAILTLALAGCGGGLSAADVKSLEDSANLSLQVEAIVGDGGACSASQVRALERAAWCSTASVLASHGQPVIDAGIVCVHP